jgi:hypothetical protein
MARQRLLVLFALLVFVDLSTCEDISNPGTRFLILNFHFFKKDCFKGKLIGSTQIFYLLKLNFPSYNFFLLQKKCRTTTFSVKMKYPQMRYQNERYRVLEWLSENWNLHLLLWRETKVPWGGLAPLESLVVLGGLVPPGGQVFAVLQVRKLTITRFLRFYRNICDIYL